MTMSRWPHFHLAAEPCCPQDPVLWADVTCPFSLYIPLYIHAESELMKSCAKDLMMCKCEITGVFTQEFVE